jgi:hypothetical protein
MTDTFLGIPMEIDELDKSRTRQADQWDAAKFEEMVKPLLEAGVSIKWEQYTPYFNDGDVCEFSVGEVRFRIDPESEDGDYDDGFLSTYDVQLKGGEEEVYTGVRYTGTVDRFGYQTREYVYEKTGRVFDRHPALDEMKSFSSAMNYGHFEELLYDLFGDHAEVTITPEKIVKEYYSHD